MSKTLYALIFSAVALLAMSASGCQSTGGGGYGGSDGHVGHSH